MYQEIDANRQRTVFLVGGFLLFIIGLGWLLSYALEEPLILPIAVIFASIQAWVGYFFSDQVALALSGAKELPRQGDIGLKIHRLVENLSITAGVPKPRVYLIEDPAPNAFAAGRDPQHAVVAVTRGLVEQLEKTELEGVIAHELAHIGNYDIRVMSIVVVLVGVVSLITDFFLRMLWYGGDRRREGNGLIVIAAIIAAILAPIIATLIQFAVSRKREYLADATGALHTRYPEGLANALVKISKSPHKLRRASSATNHLYIENPLTEEEEQSWFVTIFSTHPPVKERIKRLRAMVGVR